MDDQPILITPEQAARRLGISRSKVYELIDVELLPVCRIGRRTLLPIDGVDHFVRLHTKPSLFEDSDEDGDARILRR